MGKAYQKMIMTILFVSSGFVGAEENQNLNNNVTYKNICGYCHDTGIGPEITGRKLPVEYTTYIVRHGFRAMPAFPETHVDKDALITVAKFIEAAPSLAERQAATSKE